MNNSFKGEYPELSQANLMLKSHLKSLYKKLESRDKEIDKLKSDLAFSELLRTTVYYN